MSAQKEREPQKESLQSKIAARIKKIPGFKIPLALKFILIIGTINIVIGFIIVYFDETDELSKIKWEIRHEGNFFTEIALMQAQNYFKNNFEQIEQARSIFHFMAHDKADPEIKSVMLFNRGAGLIEGFGADKKFEYQDALIKDALKSGNTKYYSEGPYRLWIYTPIAEISLDGAERRNIIGVFGIELDYRYRVARIKHVLYTQIVFFSINAILISIIIYIVIYFLIIRPIRRLELAAHHIGEGEFEVAGLREADYKNANEIENLESGILKMAMRLKNLFAEKDKASQALRESEELYRSLINASPDGIIFTDSKSNITYASPKALELHGIKRGADVTGKSSLLWIHPSDHERAIQSLKDVLLDKPRKSNEYLLIREGEGTFYGEINSRRIDDAFGNLRGFVSITRDISERKKFEQSLIDAKEQIALVIDSIPVMVAYISSDERYIYANKGYMDAFGKTRDEIIGKKVNDVVPAFAYNIIKDKIKKVFAGEIVQFESPLFSSGQKERYGYVAYVPHFEDKNRVKAYFVFIQDITESREYKEELIRARDKAEISDKLKSEFLAQMSHEIRTPINAILSFTSLIQEQVGEISGDLSDSFSIIDRAGQRIIRTIQLILDMSQVQSGTYEPNMRNIDLYSDILIKLFVEYKSYAKDKTLSLYLKKETENAELMGDEYTLKQIFSNLLDNAIKYTFKGHVEITIKRNDNGNLCAVISDTGIGISAEYQKNLFQPFTQEEMGYTRKFEGNGLGLALVKKFCEINKAHIFVESEKGKGSVFTLEFTNN
jgi:PAS domain S-box-containing protein